MEAYNDIITDKKKKKKKKEHYLTSAQLYEEYYKSKETGVATNKFIKYFGLIARRYARRYNNLCPQDLDFVVADAVSEAFQKWQKFNPEKSENIFAFYTQMIKNDMTASYNRLRKNSHLNISIEGLYKATEK